MGLKSENTIFKMLVISSIFGGACLVKMLHAIGIYFGGFLSGIGLSIVLHATK